MASKKSSKKNQAKTKIKPEKKTSVVSSAEKPTDSTASHESVNYRVSFLVGQNFRGRYYKQGESIVLPENDAKAYLMRSTLKIEPIKKNNSIT